MSTIEPLQRHNIVWRLFMDKHQNHSLLIRCPLQYDQQVFRRTQWCVPVATLTSDHLLGNSHTSSHARSMTDWQVKWSRCSCYVTSVSHSLVSMTHISLVSVPVAPSLLTNRPQRKVQITRWLLLMGLVSVTTPWRNRFCPDKRVQITSSESL